MKKNENTTISSSFVSYSKSYRNKFFMLLYALFMAAPSLVHSQNLDDFRTAASGEGVNLIPFSDIRKDAASVADEVQRRKEEAKSFDYGVFESQKNNFLKEIKKKKDEIEGIKKDIDDLKKKYTEISVTCLEDDIKKRETTINDNKSKISDLNDKMGKAVDIFERLYNARAGLREYFGKALSQLSDARSNPDRYIGSSPSDDDKKKLEDYIKVIEDQIQSRIKEHQEQEEGAKRTKADYENLIKKTEL